MLANVDLKASVSSLLERKHGTPYAKPVTALFGQNSDAYLSLLKKHNILHLPLVDEEGHVTGLVRLDDFVPTTDHRVQALIMAGGAGTRLHPLTKNVPKPMLLIGGQPLMEITLQRLHDAGIKHVSVAVNHKREKILEHFGDGTGFDIQLSYISEDRPH